MGKWLRRSEAEGVPVVKKRARFFAGARARILWLTFVIFNREKRILRPDWEKITQPS
jgi:hypothetical protein